MRPHDTLVNTTPYSCPPLLIMKVPTVFIPGLSRLLWRHCLCHPSFQHIIMRLMTIWRSVQIGQQLWASCISRTIICLSQLLLWVIQIGFISGDILNNAVALLVALHSPNDLHGVECNIIFGKARLPQYCCRYSYALLDCSIHWAWICGGKGAGSPR